MERPGAPKRTSFLVDERTLQRAKKLLGVSTDAEAVRLAVKRIAEMEKLWREMRVSRKALPPGGLGEV